MCIGESPSARLGIPRDHNAIGNELEFRAPVQGTYCDIRPKSLGRMRSIAIPFPSFGSRKCSPFRTDPRPPPGSRPMPRMPALRALPWLVVACGTVLALAWVAAASATPVVPLLLVAGLTAVVLAPAVLPAFRRNLWAGPLLAALGLMLADPAGVVASDTALRYLPVLAVLAVALAAYRSSSTVSMPRVLVLVLAVTGTIGAVIGRIAFGVENGVLPIMLPMLVAVLPTRAAAFPLRNDRGIAVALSLLGSAVMVVGAMGRGGLAGFTIIGGKHEQAFFGVLAPTAASPARPSPLALLAVLTTAIHFATYPAATFLVAAIAGVGTLLAAPAMRLPTLRRAVGVVVFVAVMVVSTNLAGVIRWFAPYFAAVGKVDNGSTRLQIESAALQHLANPLFGTFFSGDVTVLGKLSGHDVVVPVHNDYLAMALAGGYIGLALFVGFLVLVNGAAFAGLPRLARPTGRLQLAVLAAFNAAAVSSFANPVLMKPSATLVVFALGAAVLALRPARESAPAPASDASGAWERQPAAL